MPQAAPSVVAPAVASGLVFGFLGGAPFVQFLNCASLEESPWVDPSSLEKVTLGIERGFVPSILFGLLVNLGLGILFATTGGLIGGAVFQSTPVNPATQLPQ